MESATPLDAGLMESEETLMSRRGSLVTDDRTIHFIKLQCFWHRSAAVCIGRLCRDNPA